MQYVLRVSLVASLCLLPTAVRTAEPVPIPTALSVDPDPAVRLAGTAARAVERDEAAWRAD